MKIGRRDLLGVGVAGLFPSVAHAQALTPFGVFMDADIVVKLVIAGLIISTIAAAVIGSRKLAVADRLTGGSAFLSALRLGGPLIGLLGAAYVGLMFFIGISNAPTTPSMTVLAPGLAEMVLLVALGMFAGTIAVTFHWAVDSRIDRALLKS